LLRSSHPYGGLGSLPGCLRAGLLARDRQVRV